jgi:ParB family chromosome partitioning protein
MTGQKPTAPVRGPAVLLVPIGHLHPNPNNPRHDLGDLTDLVDSITEHGVLQPLLATPRKQGGLQLLAGHRRLAACKIARQGTVPVIIIGPKLEDDQLTIALIENLHRAQLSPMDEARACAALLGYGRSRDDVAFDLARSAGWVAGRLALLELPRELQRKVDAGTLPIGKATHLGYQNAKHGSGSVTLHARAPYHFTKLHDLAEAATARCDGARHPVRGRLGPACGRCWEDTIRADERGVTAQERQAS